MMKLERVNTMNIDKTKNDIWQDMLNELFSELLKLQDLGASEKEINAIEFKISHITLRMNGFTMDDYGKYHLESN